MMLINFLFAAIKAGTPLLFGTTGEIMNEKVGHLNLGVEGMMFMGAFSGFFVGYHTDNVLLALLAAILAGMLGALIYAFLTVTMMANQNVTGLTLTIFGSGFARFFGEIMISKSVDGSPKLSPRFVAALSERTIPVLGEIPVMGKLLFSHNPLVYLAIVIAILCGIYIKHTRAGLNMRAVGENPATADAAGINVLLVKYVHILIGGGICGLGGAYLSLINGGGVWNNSCVNGQGWIAVALVIFASWSPVKAILGSLIFGGFSILQFYVRKSLISLPNAFYVMLPFLITVIILIVTSMQKSKKHAQPAACGENYFREER
ncbi:nucleoside ABC transporter membrane protein [Clostridium aceticum]|uniref:Nucleoside ABC transporter membrane protein n=1 Tax=Clostridium aceticum TaxID=84022 RepID=A0A0D8IC17_9CLOT|nr:ABC transporter permease [Clostridium aceticum]AKL96913.1 nucleoside ABC transporter membrane protein [Clostridium aceticum]KJF27644.1 ABC transporter permease [Clostridium aceticum]